MKRRIAFIIMLVLCFSIGITACILANQPNILPASATVSPPAKQAILSAPKGGIEEEKKAVLPTLPELPQSSDSTTSSESVETIETDSTNKPAPHYRYTASHSSQRLFIRDGDSIRAKIIGSLRPGESGEVISIGEAWVYLKYKDLEGYVFKEYLELTEIPQSEGLPES